MSSLGSRIKAAREKKGLLQGDLAKRIGVNSAAVVSNWEKDSNKPDVDKVVRLCQALSIPVSHLLDCYVGEDQLPLSQEEAILITKYRSLDSEGKRRVQDYLKEQLERVCGWYEHVSTVHSYDPRRPLFLNESDPGYSAMKSSLSALQLLQQEYDRSISDICNYLVGLHCPDISPQTVEKLLLGELVPSDYLFNAVFSFFINGKRVRKKTHG